jgi:Chaperone of endosialidase
LDEFGHGGSLKYGGVSTRRKGHNMSSRSSWLLAAVTAGLCLARLAAAQTVTSTTFTYQGQLMAAGGPGNGTYDIRFRLFDAASAGSQVGATICRDNVPVSGGQFTVSLDFGIVFTGPSRWLELNVRADSTAGNCGTGTYTTLSPRQPLTAAPYAAGLSLPVQATTSVDNDAFFIGQTGPSFSAGRFAITNASSFAAALIGTHAGTGPAIAGLHEPSGNYGWIGTSGNAVFAETHNLPNNAVYGRNTSSGNIGILGHGTYAVYGTTANLSGAGGYFENLATGTGNAAGVMGVSTSGIGVYGSSSASKFGVYGVSPAPSGGAGGIVGAGVLGDSSTNDGVTGIAAAGGRSGVSGYALNAGGGGVFGKNNASNNFGVIGGNSYGVYGLCLTSGGQGVVGLASATSGGASGVYGQTLSTTGFGVYGTLPTASGVPLPGTGGGVMGDSGTGDGVVGFSSALSGVYGLSSAPGGAGVYGSNFQTQNYGAIGTPGAGAFGVAVASGGTGVFGQAFGSTGTNYGVVGRSDSPAGYGGYFVGRGYFSDNVGINVEQATVPLQVSGGTDASLGGGGNIVVGQVGAANVVIDNNEIMARNNGGAANLYINALGGQVGIGTNAPNALLSVNGAASKPGGGSWASFSDARLKKSIRPIRGALGTLLSLRGVTFEYIDPASINELPGTRTGMIAQEVEKVVPDWVEAGSNGMKRVTYRGFEALTVEAFRDQQRDIDSLRAENAALRDQLASLASDVTALKSRADAKNH